MSMYADIVDTVKSTKGKCLLTDDQAIRLLIDITGCVEWDLDGVDYDSDNWPEQEVRAAKKALSL